VFSPTVQAEFHKGVQEALLVFFSQADFKNVECMEGLLDEAVVVVTMYTEELHLKAATTPLHIGSTPESLLPWYIFPSSEKCKMLKMAQYICLKLPSEYPDLKFCSTEDAINAVLYIMCWVTSQPMATTKR